MPPRFAKAEKIIKIKPAAAGLPALLAKGIVPAVSGRLRIWIALTFSALPALLLLPPGLVLFRMYQHIVGFIDFVHFPGGVRIVRMQIGMAFFRFFSVGFFDFILCRAMG